MSPFEGAGNAARRLACAEVSSGEMVDALVDRIDHINPSINAVVVDCFEDARVAARAADVRLRNGERLPLLGVPITVKESLGVPGMPTTFGIPDFRNWYPKTESLVVKRLREAGAIVLGKTNVSIGLTDWQCANPIYGRTLNPWDVRRTPGGSSGGSAAAIATGLSFLDVASDVAGSIRIPAHFCGVFGHRPTQGLVSSEGAAMPGRGLISVLSTFGPLARTAADLALAMEVIAGADSTGMQAWTATLPASRLAKLQDARVLVLINHPLVPLARCIEARIEHFVEAMRMEGVSIDTHAQALPDLAECARQFMRLLVPSGLLNMAKVHYDALIERARTVSADDDSLAAEGLRACLQGPREWSMACELQLRMRDAWRRLLQMYDVVVCPVSPTTAFPHDDGPMHGRLLDVDGRSVPYLDQMVWIGIASLCGFPATTVPFGRDDDGLPIGLQLMGAEYADLTTIAFAGFIERSFGGFVPPPLFDQEYRGTDQVT
jgi:amidase